MELIILCVVSLLVSSLALFLAVRLHIQFKVHMSSTQKIPVQPFGDLDDMATEIFKSAGTGFGEEDAEVPLSRSFNGQNPEDLV